MPRPNELVINTSPIIALVAAGLDIVTDHIHTPNIDNPRGYYEFERVKKLPDGDVAWVKDAQGKVVKVIAALLKYLPPAYTYKVLFMRRHMDEILASQRQMLIRRVEDPEKSTMRRWRACSRST